VTAAAIRIAGVAERRQEGHAEDAGTP